ncbi:small GTP-binding protein [Histomonas meleagridis]|uniref:small GTP-binding protein n=1 Tax=Histomonas meleagridis TaxID=135588 RepID=UPI00355A80D2|nr:small GTP-binding protein [Histomonas meleagridis]KAH0803951.1 small GTP-binding protein [Histomonas meleagridis]
MDDENTMKVIFVGSSGVGKTSLLNYFRGENLSTVSTVSPENYTKTVINSRNIKVKLDLWDTAGQEEYQAIMPMYYRGANVAIVCANKENLNTLTEWIDKVIEISPECTIFLTVTKSDLLSSNEIEEATKFVDNLTSNEGLAENYFVTSAITGDGVENLFGEIADCNIKVSAKGKSIQIQSNGPTQNEKKGCCN